MGEQLLNDPSELLELVDRRSESLGRGKARDAVHHDGDWHRTFHCWIVRQGDGGLEVVLQKRALTKDTFPGCWDASAAGHWRFGEDARMAARELQEELGIDAPFATLTWMGREPTVRRTNGLIDREVHEVYRLRWDAPLTSYRPDVTEVIGLAALPAAGWLDLLGGHVDAVPASESVLLDADGRLHPADVAVPRGSLVPYSQARARRLLRGA